MINKFLSILLAVFVLFSSVSIFASCGKNETTQTLGESEDLLPIPAVAPFEVPADFKIGLICLHDENSTYDLNFIRGLQRVKEALGLSDNQVLIATGIGEDDTCYTQACDFAT